MHKERRGHEGTGDTGEGVGGAEVRECRDCSARKGCRGLQWAHRHGAEGAEATAGAEYSHKSSRSAVAVHRRWPPPPGSPTRLWPACGSCPWPWRTAQASARPLPGVGCRKGCRARRGACRARAGHVQSVRQSARRALQSACRRSCALAKPMSRPVFLRMAFSIASLFLKRSVDSLVITTILRPSACSRRSTACACAAGAARHGGRKPRRVPPRQQVSPSCGNRALHPGRRVGEAASPRGLCEQL